jgi:hypothetical protein
MSMHPYKKPKLDVRLPNGRELSLPIAVCRECGIVEPRCRFEYSNDFHILEWWHVQPLHFIHLKEKFSRRSYEVETDDDDELRNVLIHVGEAWTRGFSVEDVKAVLRKRLFEVFNVGENT